MPAVGDPRYNKRMRTRARSRKKKKTIKRRARPAFVRPSRIPRDVLLSTVQIGPVIETQAIAFAARGLLMNQYGIDASIYPFGVGKFQLRIYSGTDLLTKRYADFYLKQLQDLFTFPARRAALREMRPTR